MQKSLILGNIKIKVIFKKNPEYYHWIIKSDFPLNTKEKFTEIKLKGISSQIL